MMTRQSQNTSDLDCDNQSEVSPLQCGSISPNLDYDPARDPRDLIFIPPSQIFVQGKIAVPQWLRLDTCDLVSSTFKEKFSTFDDLRQQVSWDSLVGDTVVTNQWKVGDIYLQGNAQVSPELCRCAKSTNSTLRTSPTDLSSDEDESVRIEIAPESVPAADRLSLTSIFNRRRRSIRLRRSRGCFT